MKYKQPSHDVKAVFLVKKPCSCCYHFIPPFQGFVCFVFHYYQGLHPWLKVFRPFGAFIVDQQIVCGLKHCFIPIKIRVPPFPSCNSASLAIVDRWWLMGKAINKNLCICGYPTIAIE
ncbi:MAG: hypothetical protein IT252_11910 [Chitinophagaceae bacterium]|nr:hypothetical protein [Chitinophagaceae bacterium]